MTNPRDIRHLWTHKTQDHPWAADEELVIDRAEGVWVERGAIVYARGSVLRLAPPLCITASEVDQLAGIVADSIVELEKDLGR